MLPRSSENALAMTSWLYFLTDHAVSSQNFQRFCCFFRKSVQRNPRPHQRFVYFGKILARALPAGTSVLRRFQKDVMRCVGLSCKYFYVGECCCQREYDCEYSDGEYPVWGERWRAHQERADHVRGVAQRVDLRKNHEYGWKLP